MKHSKDAVLQVANTLSLGLIELEKDVAKELGVEGSKCEELKYRLADLVAMARCVTADIGDTEYDKDEDQPWS